jgi:hypothetical protein
LITFAFVPLCAGLLEAWRRRPSSQITACLVALFWVWGQCHGGVLYGVAILGAFALDGLARGKGWLDPGDDEPPVIHIRLWGILVGLCLLAPMLGPAGPGSLLYAVWTLGKLRGMGLETLEFVRTGDGVLRWLVLAGMVVGTGLVGWFSASRAPRWTLILAMFALGSLGAVRDKMLWFLLAAGPLAVILGRYLQTRPVDIRATMLGTLLLMAASMTLSLLPGRNWSVVSPSLAPMLPSGALDFLAKTRPEGSNMFTPGPGHFWMRGWMPGARRC